MLTIRLNGRPTELRDAALSPLLAELGIEPGRAGVAVALNGEVVPRSGWERTALEPGDELEIVGARQGG